MAGMRPIGVFDSGVGGLTVVRALSGRLPGEEIVYFGDTARVPYGTKSAQLVIKYSMQIARFLQKFEVKLIVVACNTASALALDYLADSLPIPVVGVIVPGAEAACRMTGTSRVGVIGTPSTVRSRAYEREIKRIDPRVDVTSAACPLFVPIVEAGYSKHPAARLIAEDHLKPVLDAGIDTLVLGCTHYPLLKGLISDVAGDSVTLVDSGEAAAEAVERALEQCGLAESGGKPRHRFYSSDTDSVTVEVARRFLGVPVEFELVEIERY